MSLECQPSGMITYRQLAHCILEMDETQLDCAVMVEDRFEDEVLAAELRVCGPDHDHLGDSYPVLYLL